MQWAAGFGPPPAWANRLTYAERFGIAPHLVGKTPAIWFYRWLEWEFAKSAKSAKQAVETHGMGKVSDATREMYNDLILGLRDDNTGKH